MKMLKKMIQKAIQMMKRNQNKVIQTNLLINLRKTHPLMQLSKRLDQNLQEQEKLSIKRWKKDRLKLKKPNQLKNNF